MAKNTKLLYRIPPLVIAFLSLLFGMLAGLARLGWFTDLFKLNLSTIHGPLMVAGFLGIVISLERAVAMDRPWSYSVPLIKAVGLIFLLTGVSSAVGSFLFVIGAAGLVLILGVFLYRQPALFSAILVLGALMLLIGNLFFYLGYPIHIFVFWWLAFLVFTISGERLELSRLIRISGEAQALFIAGILIFVVGLFFTHRLIGVAMIFISLWLLRYDVASRTLRHAGLPRFIATCLLSGNIWLGIGGILTFFYGDIGSGPYYDAYLHSVLLGFVFAMIFGHAPIIFPAILGINIPFRIRFYIHLSLLQISLVLRLAGDFLGLSSIMQWGGLINAITLLLFLGNTASAAISAKLAEGVKNLSPEKKYP